MSFPRYPAYRESATWLGDVPAHWDVVRIKQIVASIEQGWSPQCESFPAEMPEEWGVMKVGCVNGGTFRPSENKKLPAELQPMSQYVLKRNDLLISRANTRELVGSAALVPDDFDNLLLCDKLYRLRTKDGLCLAGFLTYYLGSRQAKSQMQVEATGASSSMLNIGQSAVLDLQIPLACRAEQARIVGFLDRETAKIDALIAEQEKLIALLAEKRQATISHAVTRGLDPDAPMKDSGVAWLGEVPAHWAVSRLKRVVLSIEQGWSPQCENFPAEEPEEWGVLKVGCVNGGTFDSMENKKLPPELTPLPEYALRAGDLLISRANTKELVGSAAVVPSNFDRLLLCDKLYRLRLAPDECLPDYAAALLGTREARSQIELAATGASSSMLNIGQSVVLDLPLPLPVLAEQHAIVDFLHAGIDRLNALSHGAQQAVSLLKERRSALIAAAVTGQIDVRDTVAV